MLGFTWFFTVKHTFLERATSRCSALEVVSTRFVHRIHEEIGRRSVLVVLVAI